jgi:PAS domain S-box-containing protein
VKNLRNRKETGKKARPKRRTDPASLMTSENRQELTIELLKLLNSQQKETDTIRKILGLIKKFTNFEAVGIRLQDGEDFPYYVTNGFPGSFVESEKYLCSRDKNGELDRDSNGKPYLECMCGNVICGRTDPLLPYFTEYGSFWTNSTTELLNSTSEEERQSRTRNRCNSEGYECVALIPLQSDGGTIGLLQLNDTHEDVFTRDMISFFEGIGSSIGIALARLRSEETIRRSQGILAEAERIAHLASWEWYPASNTLTVSDELYRIFGLEQIQSCENIHKPFVDCIDSADLKRVSQGLRKLRDRKKNIDIEFSIIRTDGERRYVRTKTEVFADASNGQMRIVGLTQDITEKRLAEKALLEAQADLERRVKERTAELASANKQLKQKQKEMEKKNIALGEILGHINNEKDALKLQFTRNIEEAVIPAITRLKELSNPADVRSFEILEQDLREISSPFLDNLRNKYRKLTPREAEVCRLIKHGYTSKEISQTLHISDQTVIKQRKMIRKKLGISNKAINLTTFLESIEH